MAGVGGAETWSFTCIWKIENFSYCTQRQCEYLESPSFVADSLEKTKWHLYLYPRGRLLSEYIVICLLRETDDKGPPLTIMDFELAILSSDCSPHETFKRIEKKFYNNTFCEISILRNQIVQSPVFLSLDTLTIRCSMKINCVKDLGTFFSPEYCLVRTRIAVNKRYFTWIIEDFTSLEPYDRRNIPVEFSSVKNLSLSVFLTANDKYQFEFCQVDNMQRSLSTCRISVLDSQNEAIVSGLDGHVFEEKLEDQLWQFPELIIKSKLIEHENEYLVNKALMIRCEYAISLGNVTNEIEERIYNLARNANIPSDDLDKSRFLDSKVTESSKDNLMSLCKDKNFGDATLQTKSSKFHVHKAILCSKSPAFCNMFERNLKEQTNNCVEISDLDDFTIEQLISYIYCDTVEDMQWGNASNLYFAADKYGILPLKRTCSSLLKTKLRVFNAIDILVLADTHQDRDLKVAAQEYISSHREEIVMSLNIEA